MTLYDLGQYASFLGISYSMEVNGSGLKSCVVFFLDKFTRRVEFKGIEEDVIDEARAFLAAESLRIRGRS